MHLLDVVLGDLIYDRVNELQIEKFHLGSKLYSNTFPTGYPSLNLDTGKPSKRLLQMYYALEVCATHWARTQNK